MKKIASILILVFAFTFSTQAQKNRNEKSPQLSIEQHAVLAVKKMTLALDLSKKQQNELKPLLRAQGAEKKAAMQKRKEARKNKPTADEIFAMKNKQLDSQIAFKSKMKDILNKEQFDKFEKMKKGRKMKGNKMMKKKKMMMEKKGKKNRKEHKKE